MKLLKIKLFAMRAGGRQKPSVPLCYQMITDTKPAPPLQNVWKLSATIISECTEILGEGSFGVCRKASIQGSPVCVKEFRDCGSYSKQIFLHEASVLSKLCHESVCFMFGIQSDSNPYCLVMNLYTVDGMSNNVHDFLFPRGSTLVYRTYHLSSTF